MAARVTTQGVVIRRVPYQETSEVLHLITPDHGMVGVLARGIHRPRSPFGGPLDLLDLCEVGYVNRREGEGLALATTLKPVRRWTGLRRRSACLQAAYIATDLVRELVQPEDVSTELFQAFVAALEQLDGTSRPGLVLAWFRMRALVVTGHRPELGHCVSCRRKRTRGALVDLAAGGVMCRRCAGERRRAPPLPGRVLDLLEFLAEASSPEQALEQISALDERTRRGVTGFLRNYTASLLGRLLVTEGGKRLRML